MLTPKSPKKKSDFQSDNWEKRLPGARLWHPGSVCLTPTWCKKPFSFALSLCSDGSWGCIYRLSDHTVHMKNDDQMEIWSGEFGLFPRKEVEQQTAGVLKYMWTDSESFWRTPSHRPAALFGSVITEKETRQCTCAQFAYLFSSSLDIQLIHLFIWRKGNTQADLHRHTSPFRSSSGQDSDWSGGLPLLHAQANKHSPGWMGPLGGMADSVSG